MADYRIELLGYYSSGEIKPISDISQQCAQSEKARQELMRRRSAGYLFHSIIDALTDDLPNLVRKSVGNIEEHGIQTTKSRYPISIGQQKRG